jgi:signal transduction histidine kinase
MTPLTNSPSLLRWMFRSAEWALLIMMTLLYAIDQYYYKIQVAPNIFLKVVAFNLVFFLFSFSFPVKRPLWQRRVYVVAEIALIVIAQMMWVDLRILLYFILIKSCFLLSRREVISVVVLAGAGYLFGVIWTIPSVIQSSIEAMQLQNWKGLYKPQVIFFEALIEYVGISLFVVLLGFVIVAEQRSRQHAEYLAQEVETLATSLERSRIAREIHDSLGHILTTLNIQLELAQEMWQRDPARSLQALQNSQRLASECLDEVRRAVKTVRQKDLNLNEALHKLIQQVEQNQSIAVDADIHLPQLPLQINHQLYCIVQEGFLNIQKHAQATRIKLRAYVNSDMIFLEIEDNGKGFQLTLPHAGYGLQGMTERTHLLGGNLEIQSTPEHGTHIQVKVPL